MVTKVLDMEKRLLERGDIREARLVFRRSELMYDVANYSFIEADIMPENSEHSKHQVFDITQEGNVDRVTRLLNLYFLECVEMLFPFTKEAIAVEGVELDDKLREPDTYEIVLRLPSDFSLTTLGLLENLIHDYLVCRVLSDWMSITFPESMEKWELKARGLKDKISTSLVGRIGKVKRKLKPW